MVVSSDLAPGQLGSKLVSRSDGNLFEAEMMTKDASDQNNGGEHPWSTLDDDQSVLILFNHDQVGRDIHVHIFGQTSSWERIYKLAANETKQIDINEAIADQIKDQDGKTLDKGEHQGIVVWSASDPRYVKGRLLISNRTTNMARSFSCATTIVVCGGYVSVFGGGYLPIDQSNIYGQANSQCCVSFGPGNCSGSNYPGGCAGSNWTLGNTAIVNFTNPIDQISGVPHLTGISAGTTTAIVRMTANSCTTTGVGNPPPAVQVPKSDPIFSVNVNAAAPCTTGSGWVMDVNKHIADQNGEYILTPGQTLTETYTIGTPNQLGLTSIQTGTTATNSAGIVADEYSVCSTACPSGGETDATQHPSDQLPGSSTIYPLTPNNVVYKCSSISVNGKTSW